MRWWVDDEFARLQTVIHNKIPMKIIIFNNDGTNDKIHQDAIVGGRRSGTDKESGLTCPNYENIAKAFGSKYISIKDDSDIEKIDIFLKTDQPIIFEVFMKTNQPLVPKLSVSISKQIASISSFGGLKTIYCIRQIKKIFAY